MGDHVNDGSQFPGKSDLVIGNNVQINSGQTAH